MKSSVVMRGLDPRIHLLEMMDWVIGKRSDAVPRTAMLGNGVPVKT
jgi:hypothetical protein